MTFLRDRQKQGGPLAEKVQIALADENHFTHEGTLDFIDNTLDRTSGTIHARATVPDADGLLTPGGFARVRVEVAPPALTLLVPDASVLPDQSDHIVLTVASKQRGHSEAGPNRRPARRPPGHSLRPNHVRPRDRPRHPDRSAGRCGDHRTLNRSSSRPIRTGAQLDHETLAFLH